jgi:hypothetical protein
VRVRAEVELDVEALGKRTLKRLQELFCLSDLPLGQQPRWKAVPTPGDTDEVVGVG